MKATPGELELWYPRAEFDRVVGFFEDTLRPTDQSSPPDGFVRQWETATLAGWGDGSTVIRVEASPVEVEGTVLTIIDVCAQPIELGGQGPAGCNARQ